MFRKGWHDGDVLSEAEIPVDPALPQLATMLDARAMRRVLQKELPGGYAEGRFSIERCRIANVRYKPGRGCVASYSLDVRDTSNGRREIQVVSGMVFAEERSKRYLARRLKAARTHGVSFANLSDHRMILTVFPNDLRVHGLHRIICSDELERSLRNVLGMPAAKLEEVEDGSLPGTIISYRPERWCLIRCAMRPSEPGRGQRKVMFARIYRDDRGEHVYRTMVDLWNGQAQRSGLPSMAEPVGYDPKMRILFQGCVVGTSLTDLAGSGDFLDYIRTTARSLAAVHQSSVRLERSHHVAGEMKRLELIARGLCRGRSAVGERLNAVLGRLRSAMPGAKAQTWGVIHGDFSSNQVLAEAGRVSLIDFDGVYMGDVHADLGTFLARLERHVPDDALRRQAAEEFLQEYEAAQDRAVAYDRLLWHQARAFTRLAISSVSHLKPGWPGRVDKSLDRAETLLSEMENVNYRSGAGTTSVAP